MLNLPVPIQKLIEKEKIINRRKSYKLIYFIYRLMEEKKVYDLEKIKNYCASYFKTHRNTVMKTIREMESFQMVKITSNLLDARKKTIFLEV